MTDFGRVGLLFGGDSAERAVSLQSAAAVRAAMQTLRLDFVELDGVVALREALAAGELDRIFSVMHGGAGENGVVQGLARAFDVPMTGAGVLGCALSMDKDRCKAVWARAGIPVAEHRVLRAGDDPAAVIDALGLPLVVKPVHEGSSVGVAICRQADELSEAVSQALTFDHAVMAERFIDGREFTASMVAGEVLPLIEVTPADGFYDYHAKYESEATQYVCPVNLAEAEQQRLQTLCRLAFDAVDVTGWGRVDLIREHTGEVWFLEVNTAPGMTSHSLVPMAAKARGWDFAALVEAILQTTMNQGETP